MTWIYNITASEIINYVVHLFRIKSMRTFIYTFVHCQRSGSTESDADQLHQSMLEANLSTEVALVVLDIISIYSNSFRVSSISSAQRLGNDSPGTVFNMSIKTHALMHFYYNSG